MPRLITGSLRMLYGLLKGHSVTYKQLRSVDRRARPLTSGKSVSESFSLFHLPILALCPFTESHATKETDPVWLRNG